MVASNLFGDILSDLGAAVAGSIGIAPVGQPQSGGRVPLDVRAGPRLCAGHRRAGIANPIGQIWSGAMMLDHLGHEDAAAGVVSAIERVLGETEVRTPDLNGTATTKDVTEAILGALENIRSEDARK